MSLLFIVASSVLLLLAILFTVACVRSHWKTDEPDELLALAVILAILLVFFTVFYCIENHVFTLETQIRHKG